MLRTVSSFAKCPRNLFKPKYPRLLTHQIREIQTTPSRQNRYTRFSDRPTHPGTPPPPKNPLDYKHWDPRVKFIALVSLLGGGYYVANLERVPETGRWRFMNTSSESEAKFGELMKRRLKLELGPKILPPNHPLSIHVRRVASRILKYSNLGHIHGDTSIPFLASRFGFDNDFWTPSDDYGASARHSYGPDKEWDVVVVNDNTVINAMAAPGLILVFTGILPVCRDEQGLAAVLSHEIGHVVARHIGERMSAQTVFYGVTLLLRLIGLEWTVSHLLETYLLELPNSRTQELEADVIGLRLMARACYDPKAAPEMFERLNHIETKLAEKVIPDSFQTHPSSERRMKQLEEVLPEAYSILTANPECAPLLEQYEQFRDRAREIRRNSNGGFELV